jgi:hypothetical protein
MGAYCRSRSGKYELAAPSGVTQPVFLAAACLPQATLTPLSDFTKPTSKLPLQPCLCRIRSADKRGAAASSRGNADTFPAPASTNDRAPAAYWFSASNGVSLDSASYYSLCSSGCIPLLFLFASKNRGRSHTKPLKTSAHRTNFIVS